MMLKTLMVSVIIYCINTMVAKTTSEDMTEENIQYLRDGIFLHVIL